MVTEGNSKNNFGLNPYMYMLSLDDHSQKIVSYPWLGFLINN